MNDGKQTRDLGRREHARGTAGGVAIILQDVRYPAVDWSCGGFSLDNVAGEYQEGDEIDGILEIDGTRADGPFRAEIVRIEPSGLLAAKFRELGSSEYIELSLRVKEPAG